MWKVCLCTRNKGQGVVHQWSDSAEGTTEPALLTPIVQGVCVCVCVCVKGGGGEVRLVHEVERERESFIMYVTAGEGGVGPALVLCLAYYLL